MFRARIPLERRLRFDDFLRSLGYIAIACWAVLYQLDPSAIVSDQVQPWVQILWLGICFFGAVLASLGCILKIDIKLELPGLLFMMVGPLLYFGATIYRVYAISLAEGIQPPGLIPLLIYSILPVILLLPRAFNLYSDVLMSRARSAERASKI